MMHEYASRTHSLLTAHMCVCVCVWACIGVLYMAHMIAVVLCAVTAFVCLASFHLQPTNALDLEVFVCVRMYLRTYFRMFVCSIQMYVYIFCSAFLHL